MATRDQLKKIIKDMSLGDKLLIPSKHIWGLTAKMINQFNYESVKRATQQIQPGTTVKYFIGTVRAIFLKTAVNKNLQKFDRWCL